MKPVEGWWRTPLPRGGIRRGDGAGLHPSRYDRLSCRTENGDDVEQDGEEMKDTAGQYKEMPDSVIVRQPFPKIEDYAAGIGQPAGEQQLEPPLLTLSSIGLMAAITAHPMIT